MLLALARPFANERLPFAPTFVVVPVAGCVPAVRAARTDPTVVMRAE